MFIDFIKWVAVGHVSAYSPGRQGPCIVVHGMKIRPGAGASDDVPAGPSSRKLVAMGSLGASQSGALQCSTGHEVRTGLRLGNGLPMFHSLLTSLYQVHCSHQWLQLERSTLAVSFPSNLCPHCQAGALRIIREVQQLEGAGHVDQ